MDKRIEFKEHERSLLVRSVQLEANTQEATLLYNVLSKLLGISIPTWTLRPTFNTYTISSTLPVLRPELPVGEQPPSHTHLERNVVLCKSMETELE